MLTKISLQAVGSFFGACLVMFNAYGSLLGYDAAWIRQTQFLRSGFDINAPLRFEDEAVVVAKEVGNISSSLFHWTHDGKDVVHVVNSRYMQRQPSLIFLGKARMALFRTFCLPTLLHQTESKFIFVLHVDPFLDAELMEELVETLSPYPNFFVLKSRKDAIQMRAFETRMAEYKNETVTGDFAILQRASIAARENTLIETRLDADDGLNLRFIELVQRSARERLSQGAASVNDFVVFCAKSVLEWHSLCRQEKAASMNNSSRPAGCVIGIKEEGFCVTAGLTLARRFNVSQDDAQFGHHIKLHSSHPACQHPSQVNGTRNCLEWIGDSLNPAPVIRSRTTTSAGMKDVNGQQESGASVSEERQWTSLNDSFGIERVNAAQTIAYMEDNQAEIILDNLIGQCTKGHSCKASSVNKLTGVLGSLGRLDLLNSTRYVEAMKKKRRKPKVTE